MTLRQRHQRVKRKAPIDVVSECYKFMGERICAYRLDAIWTIWSKRT